MVEPLRVLMANDTYPPQLNGAAVATQRLASGLALRGNPVAVIAPNTAAQDGAAAEPADGQTDASVLVYRVKSFTTRPVHPQFRVTSWMGIAAKLERIFDEFQPDIVHVHNHFILGQGCLKEARKRGLPIVGTNHFMPDNLFEFIPRPLRAPVSAIMWSHFLRTYNRLDWVLAPSHACQDMLRSVGLTAECRVVSNGIDLKKYARVTPSDRLFNTYGFQRDLPVFLSVGRLEKDKNVGLIIRAAALARQEADFQVVIAGKGRDEAEFRSLAQKLGVDDRVIFTGFVPDEDLMQLYSCADVYIGAGAAELQGIAVMEGMAAGLPVLAANAVALPELVSDGDNGYLFELVPENLAARMLQVLNEKADWPRMGERSLARIQPHDMPNVLSQVEELYAEAIASARAVAVNW